MARPPRNRYVSGQLLRGADAPSAVAFARGIAPELQRESLQDQAGILQDCRVLIGSAAAAALKQMGIANPTDCEHDDNTRMGAAARCGRSSRNI